MNEELIEAVARAIHTAFRTAEYPWMHENPEKCRPSKDAAHAAIAAVEASGTHVVVPKAPTDAMLAEADSAIPRFEPDSSGHRMMGVDGAQWCWYAMIDARPKVVTP